MGGRGLGAGATFEAFGGGAIGASATLAGGLGAGALGGGALTDAVGAGVEAGAVEGAAASGSTLTCVAVLSTGFSGFGVADWLAAEFDFVSGFALLSGTGVCVWDDACDGGCTWGSFVFDAGAFSDVEAGVEDP